MNLDDLFTEILRIFPKNLHKDNITFSIKNLPLEKRVYSSDKIIIVRSSHWYGVHRWDNLDIYTDYQTYKLLGLLIFAVIFDDSEEDCYLKLTNSETQVTEIRIRNAVATLDTPGFHIKPHIFEYYPQKLEKHLYLMEHDVSRYDFPYLELNNHDEMIINEKDLTNRDILIIKGNYFGNARLAETLLNFGYESQKVEEINLECELGFGGVAPGSSELRLFSPKSSWFISP